MKKDQLNNSCVYLHVNLSRQEVFYVGIGSEKRPYDKSDRSSHWKNITKKYDYAVIIIHTNLSWEKACKLEKKYIAKFGRKDNGLGTLINYTDGGEGTKGINQIPWTKERKQAKSLKMKGKNTGPRSEYTKQRIRESKKANPFKPTEEIKLKMSEAKMGEKNHFYGKHHTEESKDKIKIAKQNPSKETRRKMSIAQKGRIPWNKGKIGVSEETRKKMKLAQRGNKNAKKKR